MRAIGKSPLAKVLDLPLAIAGVLTGAFYWYVTQPSMARTMVASYTTEHAVEYVVVAFFIWGLTDAFFCAGALPREYFSLSQTWLPRRTGREPVSAVPGLLALLRAKPKWLAESRLGRRLSQALGYVQEKGSADDFGDYLRQLAEQDQENTHSNYGLLRFICVITPMFGFLGTVVHFGTALGDQSAGDIADKLPTVVAEMGTAFHTTTIALIAATTMMFCLFLCERAERAIVFAIDARVESELQNRFEVIDVSLTPFVSALELATRSTLHAVDTALERHMTAWSATLKAIERQTLQFQERQTQTWIEALGKIDERCEANDRGREDRIVRLLEKMDVQRQENRTQLSATSEQVATLKGDFARFVDALGAIAREEKQLAGSQSLLADNVRIIRETAQIDQAMHGLTAAIHMLTARHAPGKESRAA